LLLLIDAVKELIGLKDPIFCTFETVSECVVTPAAIENLTYGGTTTQLVQVADDNPNSIGNVAARVPAGAPEGTVRSRVTVTVAELL